MSPTLLAMLYGAVGAAVTLWWMRREHWDVVGVSCGVLVGLLWPMALIGTALPFAERVIERIASRAFRR